MGMIGHQQIVTWPGVASLSQTECKILMTGSWASHSTRALEHTVTQGIIGWSGSTWTPLAGVPRLGRVFIRESHRLFPTMRRRAQLSFADARQRVPTLQSRGRDALLRVHSPWHIHFFAVTSGKKSSSAVSTHLFSASAQATGPRLDCCRSGCLAFAAQ